MTILHRPRGSNADEWAAFLSENCTHDTIGFVAVQIAEAIEEGANQAQICCDSYAAENQRFHDEIERLQAERAWQPIEVAPKDEGTEILAACYFDDGSCQMQVAQWWVESWAMVGKLSMIVLDPQPTYWTPLREPPPCP